MSTAGFFSPLIEGWRPGRRKPLLILTYSVIGLLSWKYFGSPQFYREHLQPYGFIPQAPAAAAIYSFLACFLLLGVAPALIVKIIFGEKLSDYGLSLGNRPRTIRTLLIMGPLFALGGYLGAGNASVAEYYPINRFVLQRIRELRILCFPPLLEHTVYRERHAVAIRPESKGQIISAVGICSTERGTVQIARHETYREQIGRPA